MARDGLISPGAATRPEKQAGSRYFMATNEKKKPGKTLQSYILCIIPLISSYHWCHHTWQLFVKQMFSE